MPLFFVLSMKRPYSESAFIDPAKLRDYCLNPEHPRGKHKAKVFEAKLGIQRQDWHQLLEAIKAGLSNGSCIKEREDTYGQRFNVDMDLKIRGRVVRARTAWILRRAHY
ncbi:MAG TPA: hypothetical protein VJ952_12255 [Opitutales bacterium]|nr:hypothetical protein [Opitutales bacterium]